METFNISFLHWLSTVVWFQLPSFHCNWFICWTFHVPIASHRPTLIVITNVCSFSFWLIKMITQTSLSWKRAHFSRSISKCSKTWYLTWTRIRLKIVPNMLTQGAHHLCLKKKKILTCGISCSIFCKIVRPLRNKKIEGILGNNFHHLLATLKLRGDSVGYNCVKHGCVLKKWSLYLLNIIARVITVMRALWLVEDYYNHLAQCDYSRRAKFQKWLPRVLTVLSKWWTQ